MLAVKPLFQVELVRVRYIVLVTDGISGRLFVATDPGKDLKPAFHKYVANKGYRLWGPDLEQRVIERMVCTRRQADMRVSHLSKHNLGMALQVLLI